MFSYNSSDMLQPMNSRLLAIDDCVPRVLIHDGSVGQISDDGYPIVLLLPGVLLLPLLVLL